MSNDKELDAMDYHMPPRRRLEVGQVVEGTVVLIGSSHVFLDVGGKSEASLDIQEITDDEGNQSLKVGDRIEAYVVEVEPEVILSYALARSHLNVQRLEDAHDTGIPVEGKVSAVNKGGLEVELGGARAFCPVSQIEAGYCEEPAAYVGQTLQFRVVEFASDGRDIVLSRRALLEEAQAEVAEEIRAQLQEGAELEGAVVSLQPYGAFVDLGGGIQGMVHISEIGHSRIEHPEEALSVGQTVRVRIIRIEPDAKHPGREKLSLSIRALLGDPWATTAQDLVTGASVKGTVVRLQPFGAFVEIAPGVDGLIHVSEMADRRIKHPSEVVEVGQSVTATVLKVDRSAKRISLSLLDQGGLVTGELSVGSVVDVVVDKVKPFGLLVRIKGAGRQARGLVPLEETGLGRGANLRRSYPEGTERKAMIISVEPDSGKLRLSFKGYAEQQEREDYREFIDEPASAPKKKAKPDKSMGSLGELLMKSLEKDSKGKGK
jgi:small subunit ribosomal protein S1